MYAENMEQFHRSNLTTTEKTIQGARGRSSEGHCAYPRVFGISKEDRAPTTCGPVSNPFFRVETRILPNQTLDAFAALVE